MLVPCIATAVNFNFAELGRELAQPQYRAGMDFAALMMALGLTPAVIEAGPAVAAAWRAVPPRLLAGCLSAACETQISYAGLRGIVSYEEFVMLRNALIVGETRTLTFEEAVLTRFLTTLSPK